MIVNILGPVRKSQMDVESKAAFRVKMKSGNRKEQVL